MADWVDRAQAREALELARALAAQRASAAPAGPSLPECITCGEAIPAARQALRGVTRCMPCQTTFEQGPHR